ncbi:TPA: phosphate ABC transporter permease subunit PstC [Candidatus Geothermarchaeota archaeon]|nr:phosphate ABC transporter permease subunit PstC [Candidatus Geothermarchaeota archaeon]HIQ12810.1 phosphate ABC transporter permease subunit PstC [Thermoprotei archaeon]
MIDEEVFREKVRRENRFRVIPLLASILPGIFFIIITSFVFIEAISFFQNISIWEFLTGFRWSALFSDKSFGSIPLVWATLVIAFIAIIFSSILGLGSAIYISEYASERSRRVLKPLIELLATIPTVVYGFFALQYITPSLKTILPNIEVYNALSSGIAMGIMITPIISTLAEDALYSIPYSLRMAAYSLGAKKSQTIFRILLRAALPGIASAYILAFARAIGETMIVAIAAGSKPVFTLNILESMQTMTGYIAQVATGDAPFGTIEFYSLYGVALYLLAIVLMVNLVALYISKRFSYTVSRL